MPRCQGLFISSVAHNRSTNRQVAKAARAWRKAARAKAMKATQRNSSVAVRARAQCPGRNAHSVDEGEDEKEGGDEGEDACPEQQPSVQTLADCSSMLSVLAAASVMFERGPSSLPGIPKRTGVGKNTF